MNQSSIPLSVQELTFQIKSRLEKSFPQVTVQGEISNLTKHSSGHLYFDLKDSLAKISCVLFRKQAQLLTKLPKDGDQIVVTAAINVYPPQGRYQLICEKIELQGLGQLLLQFEELKKKLQSKGWFDKKKPLPAFPKKIGVITSPTGAVIRDIIHVLKRRCPGFQLLLYPVLVQGIGAAEQIAQAIKDCNDYQLADVLIIARGGGSLEDLWAFNEEIVAEAIFQSHLPIVSAIGHETDTTIADFVADVRAPTPSAAAEIISFEKSERLKFLQRSAKIAASCLHQKLKTAQAQLLSLSKHPLIAHPHLLISTSAQKLDDLKTDLDQRIKKIYLEKKEKLLFLERKKQQLAPFQLLHRMKEKINFIQKALDHQCKLIFKWKKQQLKEIEEKLKSLDPHVVLKRGYAILFAQKEKRVLHSSNMARKGDLIEARLGDGILMMEVKDER